MKYCLLSLCLLTLFFIAPKNTFACSCVFIDAPNTDRLREETKGAKAVFSGEVLEIKEIPENRVAVKLKVKDAWKGVGSQEITVSTQKNDSACGFNFTVGESYLVFAYGSANRSDSDDLRVSQCSSTSELKKADALVEILKKLCSEATGQNTNLTGSVYDVNNVVITYAQIRLKAEDGKLYEASIGKDNMYHLSLPVGIYSVEVSADAFKTATLKNYKIISSGLKQQNLNFNLDVGAPICTVTVTAEAPKNN